MSIPMMISGERPVFPGTSMPSHYPPRMHEHGRIERRHILRTYKAWMRWWIKKFTDERLAILLAHAQSRRLSYDSCCCFVGIITANHQPATRGMVSNLDPTRSRWGCPLFSEHYYRAREIAGAPYVEEAFAHICYTGEAGLPAGKAADEMRCRFVVVMCRAEMKMRDKRKEMRDLALTTWISVTAPTIEYVPDPNPDPVPEPELQLEPEPELAFQ